MAITSPDVIPIGTPRRGGGRGRRPLEQALAEIRSLRKTLAAVTSGDAEEAVETMPVTWVVAYKSAQGEEQVVMIGDGTAAVLGPAAPGDGSAARAWRMVQKLIASSGGG